MKANRKTKKEHCPACNTEMGEVLDIKYGYLMVCQECGTQTKDGDVFNPDPEGELEKMGHLRVVQENKQINEEPEPDLQTIDAYFDSKDKKRFTNIIELEHRNGWMVLRKQDGREILLNSNKVNFIEEVKREKTP